MSLPDPASGSEGGTTALVTGASGYIAHSLLQALARGGGRVVALSRASGASPQAAAGARLEHRSGDLRSSDLWDEIISQADVIYHLAAQTSVPTAERDPFSDFESNVLPILRALESCRRLGKRPAILLSGTVTQCGVPERLPVDESHPDNPLTVYDLHKLTAERYLKHYVAKGLARGAVLRLANVYGPGPRSRAADRGVLNSMVRKALAGQALTVYGTGGHLRDYVYVGDVAQAFVLASGRVDELSGGHYVIGSGRRCTIAEAVELVAERAARVTGRRVPVERVEAPEESSPIEARDFIADASRFARATGWRAAVELMEGIDRTIESVLAEERVSR